VEAELESEAVRTLASRSKVVLEELSKMYDNFFYTLAENGVKSGTDSDEGGLPEMYTGLSGVAPWKAVSPRWFDIKMKAAAIDSYMFYRGISEGIVRKGETQRVKRSRKQSTNRNLSLYRYILNLGRGMGNTDKFFGKPKIGYELVRPDGKTVEINRDLSPEGRGGGIYSLTTHGDKGKYLSGLQHMNGTVLKSQIWLFPNLEGLLPESMDNGTALSLNIEDRVARYLGSQDKSYLMQWQKIFGIRKTGAAKTGPNKGEQKKSGQWKLRPLVTPMIQWYSEQGMKRVLEKLGDTDL
jgi:hypothetical protein